MARPIKSGLTYFPCDTDIFDRDYRILDLMDRYGPRGFTIFIALLCLVYREGYYIEIPEQALTAQIRRMIGNRWINGRGYISEVIDYCAELGLLDKGLLSQGVITSRSIQSRYRAAAKRSKADMSKYWLLDDDSPEAGLSEPEKKVSAAKTGVSAAKTRVSAAKTPQSKLNKTKSNIFYKEKGNSAPVKTYGILNNVQLTDDQYQTLKDKCRNVDDLIDDLSTYMVATKKTYASHFATLLKWDKKNRQASGSERGEASYDMNQFEKQGFDLPEVEK